MGERMSGEAKQGAGEAPPMCPATDSGARCVFGEGHAVDYHHGTDGHNWPVQRTSEVLRPVQIAAVERAKAMFSGEPRTNDACMPTSEWGCESRRKLGTARGALASARVELLGMRDELSEGEFRDTLDCVNEEIAKAIEATAQPNVQCSEPTPNEAFPGDLLSLANLVTSGDVPREVRRRVMLMIDEVRALRQRAEPARNWEHEVREIAHALGIEHAPDTGPTEPGPLERMLDEIKKLHGDVAHWHELAARTRDESAAVHSFAGIDPSSPEGRLRSLLWGILGGVGAESVEDAARRVVRERDQANEPLPTGDLELLDEVFEYYATSTLASEDDATRARALHADLRRRLTDEPTGADLAGDPRSPGDGTPEGSSTLLPSGVQGGAIDAVDAAVAEGERREAAAQAERDTAFAAWQSATEREQRVRNALGITRDEATDEAAMRIAAELAMLRDAPTLDDRNGYISKSRLSVLAERAVGAPATRDEERAMALELLRRRRHQGALLAVFCVARKVVSADSASFIDALTVLRLSVQAVDREMGGRG